LALSPNLLLASSQTVFQLSRPEGNVVSQVTAHTTPIHTILVSPDHSRIATAAVGDRFINVLSLSKTGLARLGSLTCSHDVRTIALHQQTLLAITVIGTIEVFHDYGANFEPGKKGSMTKPASVEIRLTTPHRAKIEVQDVVVRGKETLVAWIEGAKTGFEEIDFAGQQGKIEIKVQTRKEQDQKQVLTFPRETGMLIQSLKPYDDSKAVVLTGGEPAKPLVNGTAQVADLSFADRLSQFQSSALKEMPAGQPMVSNASSLTTVLTQALNSSDEKLLQTCFRQTHSHETIHNTLVRLSPALIPSLLSYFNSVLSRKQKQATSTFDWIQQTVVVHGGYLVSQGDDVRQVLARLKGTLDKRGQGWERLVRLKGRLELLRVIKGTQEGGKVASVPEVRWVEPVSGEEEMDVEIEDVRYLTGDVEDETVEIEDLDVEEQDDVLENGIEEDEEDEDEDENDSSDEEDSEDEPKPRKVNGIPHFSSTEDSEDSAVDLEDLIDEEASEADDESDQNEDDDEEDEDVPQPPPAKKSRTRR
jgi:U3 small nucleolar RNA-associated protein 5